MDALVKMVSEKTGISPEQARTAVETVLGFVKEKLPAPMPAQVEAALSSSSTLNQAQDMLGGLGGLLGGGKE